MANEDSSPIDSGNSHRSDPFPSFFFVHEEPPSRRYGRRLGIAALAVSAACAGGVAVASLSDPAPRALTQPGANAKDHGLTARHQFPSPKSYATARKPTPAAATPEAKPAQPPQAAPAATAPEPPERQPAPAPRAAPAAPAPEPPVPQPVQGPQAATAATTPAPPVPQVPQPKAALAATTPATDHTWACFAVDEWLGAQHWSALGKDAASRYGVAGYVVQTASEAPFGPSATAFSWAEPPTDDPAAAASGQDGPGAAGSPGGPSGTVPSAGQPLPTPKAIGSGPAPRSAPPGSDDPVQSGNGSQAPQVPEATSTSETTDAVQQDSQQRPGPTATKKAEREEPKAAKKTEREDRKPAEKARSEAEQPEQGSAPAAQQQSTSAPEQDSAPAPQQKSAPSPQQQPAPSPQPERQDPRKWVEDRIAAFIDDGREVPERWQEVQHLLEHELDD